MAGGAVCQGHSRHARLAGFTVIRALAQGNGGLGSRLGQHMGHSLQTGTAKSADGTEAAKQGRQQRNGGELTLTGQCAVVLRDTTGGRDPF